MVFLILAFQKTAFCDAALALVIFPKMRIECLIMSGMNSLAGLPSRRTFWKRVEDKSMEREVWEEVGANIRFDALLSLRQQTRAMEKSSKRTRAKKMLSETTAGADNIA